MDGREKEQQAHKAWRTSFITLSIFLFSTPLLLTYHFSLLLQHFWSKLSTPSDGVAIDFAIIFTNHIYFCSFHSFTQTILMLLLYRQLLYFYLLTLHEVVTNIKVKDIALKQRELYCIPMLTFKCIQMHLFSFVYFAHICLKTLQYKIYKIRKKDMCWRG